MKIVKLTGSKLNILEGTLSPIHIKYGYTEVEDEVIDLDLDNKPLKAYKLLNGRYVEDVDALLTQAIEAKKEELKQARISNLTQVNITLSDGIVYPVDVSSSSRSDMNQKYSSAVRKGKDKKKKLLWKFADNVFREITYDLLAEIGDAIDDSSEVLFDHEKSKHDEISACGSDRACIKAVTW